MTLSELFYSIGEPYAGGLFEYPDRAPLVRYANAQRRYFEEAALTPMASWVQYRSSLAW